MTVEGPNEGPDHASGLQIVADRHGVSLDAVRHLMRALEAGNGTMAQFDHPELGGMGQWFSGGMVMVGRMFDAELKARVAGLCAELADALPSAGWSGQGWTTGGRGVMSRFASVTDWRAVVSGVSRASLYEVSVGPS